MIHHSKAKLLRWGRYNPGHMRLSWYSRTSLGLDLGLSPNPSCTLSCFWLSRRTQETNVFCGLTYSLLLFLACFSTCDSIHCFVVGEQDALATCFMCTVRCSAKMAVVFNLLATKVAKLCLTAFHWANHLVASRAFNHFCLASRARAHDSCCHRVSHSRMRVSFFRFGFGLCASLVLMRTLLTVFATGVFASFIRACHKHHSFWDHYEMGTFWAAPVIFCV